VVAAEPREGREEERERHEERGCGDEEESRDLGGSEIAVKTTL
jgi:hypothetical protein